jgi:adenylate cyclase
LRSSTNEERSQRRLAAILAADVVGYSRMMEQDEASTLAKLKSRRRDVLEPLVAQHRGRVFKLTGDGVLVEFGSAVNAVQCAVDLQERMAAANSEQADESPIVLRIGINLGDVLVEGSDLYGDEINIAARLEGLAEPGGILVSGTAYDYVRNKVKVGFEDLGAQTVKNMVEPVRTYRVQLGAAPASTPSALMLLDKPSIAVMPFQNMSGDPEQEYFADGLTEDIITALSRISTFLVIARTSTFTYRGKPTDVKRVAKELGVRYVLEGSVRRGGSRVRITAQLIDATTGHHLWAERYDRSLADLFDIQDEVTRSVAASIEIPVFLAEHQAAEARPSIDFKARDLVARAISKIYDHTPEAVAEASDFVEEAISIDPSYPRAHLMRGSIFHYRMRLGEIAADTANVGRGLELARTALRLAPRDEWAHWLIAGAYAEAGRLEDAVAACERSLQINPNFSMALGRLGECLAALGRPKEAIDACRLALQLNPRDTQNFWRHSHIATAHFQAADYNEALQESKRVALSRPHMQSAIIWAASAAALGKANEARMAVEHCLAQRPGPRVGSVVPAFVLRFARDEDHEQLLAALRKAGLPE